MCLARNLIHIARPRIIQGLLFFKVLTVDLLNFHKLSSVRSGKVKTQRIWTLKIAESCSPEICDFLSIMLRRVVIQYGRFGTTYRSHHQESRTLWIYWPLITAEAWNHSNSLLHTLTTFRPKDPKMVITLAGSFLCVLWPSPFKNISGPKYWLCTSDTYLRQHTF